MANFIHTDKFSTEFSNLRDRSEDRYESGWTEIVATRTVEFLHELDEIPSNVSVLRSETSDGVMPVTAVDGTDITIALLDKDSARGSESTTISVTNDLSDNRYFKVRAI